MLEIPQFPHCDQAILHEPGSCDYCDSHPEWQALRKAWGISFTGKNEPDKLPCPSSLRRTARQAHLWPGNRPTNIDVPVDIEQSAIDRVLADEDIV